MNFLLLLSALLSALTGVGAARVEATPQAVCSSLVEVRVPSAATTFIAARPLQLLSPLATLVSATGRILALAPIEPPFANRRRE